MLSHNIVPAFASNNRDSNCDNLDDEDQLESHANFTKSNNPSFKDEISNNFEQSLNHAQQIKKNNSDKDKNKNKDFNMQYKKEDRLSNTNKCLIDDILNDDNDDIMDLVRKSRDIPIGLNNSHLKDDRFAK